MAGVNSAFGTKYTSEDVKIDKEGGAYIEVEYKGIKFNQYIYGKDGKVNDTTGLKTIAKNIEKLQNVEGLSNLEYTTDSNGYGIFKFKYNGKSTIIYFDGTEINTDNLVKYYETVEKVLRAVNEAFGTKYTIEDVKQDKTGGVYIEVEYKGVTFNQYIFGKDGKISDTTGLKTIAKSIENLQKLEGISNLKYTTDKNGYGIFTFKYGNKDRVIYFNNKEITAENVEKYFAGLDKVLVALKEAFGKEYKAEDVKADETGGAYIEVEYEGVTFKQYIFGKDGKISDTTGLKAIAKSIKNLQNLEGISELKYTTDKNGNGIFTFKYGEKDRVIYFNNKEITAENVEKYFTAVDKVLVALKEAFGKEYKAEDVKVDETGGAYIEVEYEGVKFNQYIFAKDGSISDTKGLKTIAGNIRSLKSIQGISELKYTTDKNGNGIFQFKYGGKDRVVYFTGEEIKVEELKKYYEVADKVIEAINNAFDTKYTTNDIKVDEKGGAYIQIVYNGVIFNQYIFDKDGNISDTKGLANIANSIDNLQELKGISDLEYTTDSQGYGIFKFKYNGKDRVIYFNNKEITKENIEKYFTAVDKVLVALKSAFGKDYDEKDIKKDETGGAYIEVEYEGVTFRQYLFDKNGEINDTTGLENLAKSIKNLANSKEISDLKYTTDKNGNGMFTFKYAGKNRVSYYNGKEITVEGIKKYLEAVDQVLGAVNSAFNTDYKEENIKVDETGGAYIEVTYNGVTFKQYIFNKDGNISDTTGLKTIAKNIDILQNVEGISELKYTTDKDGKGIFKFKYGGKDRIVYFDGTEIKAEELTNYFKQADKVIDAINEAFNKKYTTSDVKKDEKGGAYIQVEYEGVTFRQYIFDKDGKISDTSKLENLARSIKNLKSSSEISNVIYTTDSNGVTDSGCLSLNIKEKTE